MWMRNRNAKKRRSECLEYQVGVWIVCQHINDPRSSSSLKTIASNQSFFEPFNPIVVLKNKRRKSVHRRRTKQPQPRMQFTRYDKWQLPSTWSVYAPSPFEQHLAHVESINIQQTHIDEQNWYKTHLKYGKTRFKINKHRSWANHQ